MFVKVNIVNPDGSVSTIQSELIVFGIEENNYTHIGEITLVPSTQEVIDSRISSSDISDSLSEEKCVSEDEEVEKALKSVISKSKSSAIYPTSQINMLLRDWWIRH